MTISCRRGWKTHKQGNRTDKQLFVWHQATPYSTCYLSLLDVQYKTKYRPPGSLHVLNHHRPSRKFLKTKCGSIIIRNLQNPKDLRVWKVDIFICGLTVNHGHSIKLTSRRDSNSNTKGDEVLWWWWWCNSGRSDPQQVNNVSKIKRVAAVSNPKHFSLLFLSVRVSQELLTKKKKKKRNFRKTKEKNNPVFSLFPLRPKNGAATK